MTRLALTACLVMISISEAPALEPASAPPASFRPLDQMIYKGVGGNLLDAIPIEPEARVSLQRANAVISNPVSWRSAGILMGVTNPVFLVGGLIWGIWSAANIEPPKTDMSWLGIRSGERIGFCGRPRQTGCRLRPFDPAGAEPEPGIEATAMITPR